MKRRGRVKVAVAAGVALSAFAVAGLWFRAEASSERVDALRALCEEDRAFHRRAAALAELGEIDSSASRQALEALAASKDDRLAAQAVAAIGRANYSGAKGKLETVLGDAERSDLVRGTALAALARAEKADGRSAADFEARVEAKASGSAALEDGVDALSAKVFGARGGGR
jgi:hypothetical protein